jgi:hypothetical protein
VFRYFRSFLTLSFLYARADDFQPEIFPRVSDSPSRSRLHERAAMIAGLEAEDTATPFSY